MKRLARFLPAALVVAAPLAACADYGDAYDGFYAGGPAWYDDGCCGLLWYGGQSYGHHDWHWHGDWNHGWGHGLAFAHPGFDHGSFGGIGHGALGDHFPDAGTGGGAFHAAAGHAGGPHG